MAKKSFTTRLDEDVLAIADQIAKLERRSVTAVLEISVLEYARSKGLDIEK
ncbi:RHH-1 domain-containing protein [Acetobacteraceae bacterium EV16G]|uniref:RHH-1 domain-containing protein n=1 Tax=Sorlinia euscelidii TaxID=3081148 RepID=A0ABU7U2D8_9PROT